MIAVHDWAAVNYSQVTFAVTTRLDLSLRKLEHTLFFAAPPPKKILTFEVFNISNSTGEKWDNRGLFSLVAMANHIILICDH